ncbi:hypothetical protein AMTRI_Chr01g110980 [Amborella trichopoda]
MPLRPPKGERGPSRSKKSNRFKWRHSSNKGSKLFPSGASERGPNGVIDDSIKEKAAIIIQTAFRAYLARKTLHRMKGIVRFQLLAQGYTVQRQAPITLGYLKLWNKVQSHVRERRECMVTEGRLRRKKHDNMLKLEAKLHELEVEWCNGSETMEEILARLRQREEAAVKRERAMAYAFSHQWRANSRPNQFQVGYELGKPNWGWSWMERWIAVRPWESRITVSKKIHIAQTGSESSKPLAIRASTCHKYPSLNGKGSHHVSDSGKVKRLSIPTFEKAVTQEAVVKRPPMVAETAQLENVVVT